MKFEKSRAKAKTEVSTASLPDIIFMLLLFFMVATTMREQEIFVKFVLPKLKQFKKLRIKDLYLIFGLEIMKEFRLTII